MNRVGELQNRRRATAGVFPPAAHRSAQGVAAAPSVPREIAELVRRNHALEERLAALRNEQNEIQQALYAAAHLQRKLCAPREMRFGNFEVASEIFPVRHLSGDFYCIHPLGETAGLAVGDIAGKGLTAGLWFPHLISLIRLYGESLAELPAAASSINRTLCDTLGEPPLVALFLALLHPATGELTYCNAGQPPALLLRADGALETLQAGGPLLGAVADASFGFARVKLEPGDILIGYSDGIVECCNSAGREFGAGRLAAVARSAGNLPASTMLFSILGAVQDFAGARARDDDFTLMIVRCLQP